MLVQGWPFPSPHRLGLCLAPRPGLPLAGAPQKPTPRGRTPEAGRQGLIPPAPGETSDGVPLALVHVGSGFVIF